MLCKRSGKILYVPLGRNHRVRERAESRFHSTTKQAALIAQKAKVKKLLIGHFSSKYDTLEAFEKEAREIFPNTELALEGAVYIV